MVGYEPTPRVFDVLKNNVRINGFLETGRVDLRQKAVSDGRTATSHVLRLEQQPDEFAVRRGHLLANGVERDRSRKRLP